MTPEKIEAARKEMQEREEGLRNTLDLDMVADIEYWRCEKQMSYRKISENFVRLYPEYSFNHKIKPGNQLAGMLLCGVAQELLNQKNDERW